MKILHACLGIHEFRFFQEQFAKWGHALHAVTTGQEAMRRLRNEHPPDLFLVDRALPGMDGFSLCRWVRAHLMPRPPRLVILSEPGATILSVLASDAGADAILIKPVSMGLLKEQLAQTEVAMRHSLESNRRRFAATRGNLKAIPG